MLYLGQSKTFKENTNRFVGRGFSESTKIATKRLTLAVNTGCMWPTSNPSCTLSLPVLPDKRMTKKYTNVSKLQKMLRDTLPR
uniref:AlNc14C19G2018 protein n=1 Tax=Albugo laibachii Nc14 TaxID=890382 RepID=F0W547_9STRA|nr:AlNc14C19G2018 [Albugo laibachii Nc14]|eukprot:CCA16238.1 AlNc14C19G2018 [Albugo laibachii Nc14]